MAEQKLVKIGGAWKTVIGEFVKVGGAWKTVLANYVKIGGAWKTITVSARQIFVTEHASDRLYSVDSELAIITGWPVYGTIPPHPLISGPQEVACDSSGNSYWACGDVIFKLDEDGNILWDFTGHTSSVQSICVDGAGNVYSGDLGGTVKKISSAGAQLWTKTLGANYAVYAICIDYTGGMAYCVTGTAVDRLYRLLASNGNSAQIPLVFASDGTAIAFDWQDGKLIVGDLSGNIRKVRTDGYIEWTHAVTGGDIHALSVGHDGYVYCATGGARRAMKIIAATGASAWSGSKYTPSGTACCNGVTVDLTGMVYATYQTPGSSTENLVRKIDSDGDLVSTWKPYTTSQFFGICSRPGLKAAGW